jgi:AraC-like DNA-binding protein
MMKDVLLAMKRTQFILSAEQKAEIEQVLREIFDMRKAFIQLQYSLSHLSADSGYSRNLLSAFFNQVLGLHFNDYINQLRINYCTELIGDEDIQRYTLEGLGEKCGFHNRNTFTTAFKKFRGVPPSKFIRHGVLRKSFSQS